MKLAVRIAVVLAVALGVLAGSVAYAQDIAIVNVPFKFTVNNKMLDPGKYEVRVNEDMTTVSVTPERGQAVIAPMLTRLGQLATSSTQATLVFDKVNEQYILSEFWLPGQDGFLLKDTKQPHQHHVLKAEKKG